MSWAIAAISVDDQIEKYGAYAGLAAIIGLGVLAIALIVTVLVRGAGAFSLDRVIANARTAKPAIVLPGSA